MGLINEFKRWVSGDTDDAQDEYGYDEGYEQEEEIPVAAPKKEYRAPAEEPVAAPVAEASPRVPRASAVNRGEITVSATTNLKVVIVKAQRYKEVANIADELKNKNTVVLNLETTEESIAKRMLDFLSGVTYAVDGKIKRVANNTYLITPYDVNIVGDDLMNALDRAAL